MRLLLLCVACATTIVTSAQDYIESFTHNKDFRGSQRTMQYMPDKDGYLVSRNGKNLYTRALYGGNTLWRLETSDMPIFAAYHKTDNRNIHFLVEANGHCVRLDSVTSCVSRYRAGERIYDLSDMSWDGGTIRLTVLASHDREGAIWQIEAKNMPKGSKLTANCCNTVKIKLQRSGDMGADPANCFAPDPNRENLNSVTVNIGKKKVTAYIDYFDRQLTSENQKALSEKFRTALKDMRDITDRIKISTPDPYINTLACNLLAAADGIWDGETYMHGAIGWRQPLSGWRGAYTGDFLGWHDRARRHFDAYAASQVIDVPPTLPHPSQDSTKCLARADRKWGSQMYSNGYICRNPGKNNVMHHYDMNLCYIDELLWHLQWTGDTAYARQIWPVIKRSLEWEKRNYDPDDDGLYDAYCCIWASDALYYNSGAVTHSSAYNHRANRLAARIAEIIGDDSQPYIDEANKILQAINRELWLDDKGVWAEFRDKMGNQNVHTHPGLWTIYHAVDGDISTPEQAWRATRYIDGNIPHIPVYSDSIANDKYFTLSTTDWLPYAWSINNVAFAEVYNTALAYWQAGRPDEASLLLMSAMLDGMFMGNSPGNVGQISHYDAARGESYRDFADPVGVLSRALVQGLFGFTPKLLERRIELRPGFPGWHEASISHPDFSLSYEKSVCKDCNITMHTRIELIESFDVTLSDAMSSAADSVCLIIPHRYDDCLAIVDGVPFRTITIDAGMPWSTTQLTLPLDNRKSLQIVLMWSGKKNEYPNCEAKRYADIPTPLGVEQILGEYISVPIDSLYNANVTDIFHNKYLSPRSPFTTLQLPVQGIGEWCHPADTAHIDDCFLRDAGGTLTLTNGLSFTTPPAGNNIIFTSLYDNYPDSVTIPLSGEAKALALLMAGSTNHMQAYTPNARLTVTYADGSTQYLTLVPPYNWAPIEQDYFTDGKAFVIPTPRQQRLALMSGEVSTDLGTTLGIDGVYGRRIDGGAASIIYLPLDPKKTLSTLTLTTLANEVVIGIISATYIK